MNAILRGISFDPHPDLSDDPFGHWLVNFEPDGCVIFAAKEDCQLRVTQTGGSDVLTVELLRKGASSLLWRAQVNVYALSGPLHLIWSNQP